MIAKVNKPKLTRSFSEENSINIIHLGLGAFFRAFCCNYFQDMKEMRNAEVNVMGVSLKTTHVIDILKSQGGLYTTIEKGPDQVLLRIIDVIKEVVFAPTNPEYVLRCLASKNVSLVTLTITEKGYCFNANSGRLDVDHPDILFDLEHPTKPRSAIGYLVYGLKLRKKRGLTPFTCLSCDNLPGNGNILSDAVLQFAERVDIELFQWILENCAFPSSMVDRIVPATSEEDKNLLRTLVSYDDFTPIVHEPYRLWVVEDKFVQGNTFDFESVGVPLVPSIDNFEKMKLRCLNGTHSALAYLGYLSGFKTIYDSVSNSIFEKFLLALWSTEILPGLTPPPNFVLEEYVNDLLQRYKNPKIKHLTSQIAIDGSQKIPQRVLATIEDNLIEARKIDLLCEIVAGWIRYTRGKDELGEIFEVIDPDAEKFLKIHYSEDCTKHVIQKFLNLDNIFSKALKESKNFFMKLEIALERQHRMGSLKSLEESLK